jgi:predicted dinucleotide-binding enzyme
MTTIGFIGSGRPSVLWWTSWGPRAWAATPTEAAAAGDLVVVSLPPRAYMAVPVQPLAGQPILDTINHIPSRRTDTGAVRRPAVE